VSCYVAVTGLNKWIAVFSVGIVCTFYTTVVSFLPTYAHDTLTANRGPKPVPENPYRFLNSDASDTQFGTEFFCYQCLVTNRTCCIFVSIYGRGLLVRVFAEPRLWVSVAAFLHVCHGH